MYDLGLPVSAIPGIGPKYKKLLQNLDIFTIGNLLYHFPFRYDDFSKVKYISDLEVNEIVTVKGTLTDVKNIYTKFGKRLTKAKLTDSTGVLELIWFNSHFIKRVLTIGADYTFSGKVTSFSNKLCMIPQNYEKLDELSQGQGKLVPVYPETAGLSSKWLGTKIKDIILNSDLSEFLPDKIIQNEKYPLLNKSHWDIHFPKNQEDANIARRRFQFEELLIELLNVENRKKLWSQEKKSAVIKIKDLEKKISDLIRSLPFELTASQHEAIRQTFNDLSQEHPMNRLLEGDVGTGKTIVALICSYLVYLNNKNVLYMAPTEILAKQHLETFERILNSLGINLNYVTSFRKKENFTTPYIAIGTHALLFKEKFEDVGLVIIDEQHRFGVEQRTKLQSMGSESLTPHLLTMTATPIPRTLALTIYGDLEISPLSHIPNKLKSISTKVVPENARDKAFDWIKNSNEQTFIVCPFIEKSYHEDFEDVKAATYEYERLKKGIFSQTSIGLLHGRMPSNEKEEIVKKFENGQIKVLVSTPVIEVGIDIPQATIMVIESAERYGLASLHQLRGRVGRGGQKGYCFIFMSDNSRNSYRRLKYLEEYDNGLKLAEIDLKLRGHGDIYGIMQHGFSTLKIADLSDIDTLEKAKKYAQEYFPILDSLPKLSKRIEQVKGLYVGNN
ncbi:hypothetical protein A2V49_03010 [candidate division WWE3 bacterium RBG_19FT_COMBO_34_6]|uniref:Uncharacterized protein n=1 Tax=candidate division WWE3 bacterium RBG_19FT_COMBO_34_6 TaxID=1802612 RepID=A0A1F4UL57_UNCKA|nr:MAG: hypothetical protein A2V49_03010 [candidate division WWE3 bacterium RBG_19FT_COMBO_34_6]